MGDHRSRSHGDYIAPTKGYNGGQSQLQVYSQAQPQPQPYSGSYAYSYSYSQPPAFSEPAYNYKNTKMKSSKAWSFNDPEVKRRKRVASYKVYTVEGKVKGSFRKSMRWLKDKYTEIVYGWW